MSQNGREHLVIADVHGKHMESHAPGKAECVQEDSTSVQAQVTEGIRVENTASSEEPQLGQRVRKRRAKGQELHDAQVRKVAHRQPNQALGGACSDDLLEAYITEVRNTARRLNDVYDDWKRLEVPDNNARRRIDTCETATKEIIQDAMDLLDAREDAPVQRHTKGQRLEEEHVIEEVLSAASKRSVSSHHNKCSNISRRSAAAEIAAIEATLEVQLEQERYIKELQRLDAEAAQLKARQEAEMQRNKEC